jgi:homoserine dehydrogenase
MSTRRINIILFGIGNVGSTLISQVLERQNFFLENGNIDLRFPIITNSTLIFQEKNDVKNEWEANFSQSAIPFHIEDVIDYVKEQQLENLIAIDATETEEMIKNYIPLVQNGFDIVAINKTENISYDNLYNELKMYLKKNDKCFIYGNNIEVGKDVIAENLLNGILKITEKFYLNEAV